MFYATALDLSTLLSALEAIKPIRYTTMGLFKTKNPQTYSSFTGIPDFGRTIHPTAVTNPSYLLSIQGTQMHSREVPQKTGGVLFAVDQAENPDSVVFSPGGRYGNAVILYGIIGTVSAKLTHCGKKRRILAWVSVPLSPRGRARWEWRSAAI